MANMVAGEKVTQKTNIVFYEGFSRSRGMMQEVRTLLIRPSSRCPPWVFPGIPFEIFHQKPPAPVGLFIYFVFFINFSGKPKHAVNSK